jgi:hypothetical protein
MGIKNIPKILPIAMQPTQMNSNPIAAAPCAYSEMPNALSSTGANQ